MMMPAQTTRILAATIASLLWACAAEESDPNPAAGSGGVAGTFASGGVGGASGVGSGGTTAGGAGGVSGAAGATGGAGGVAGGGAGGVGGVAGVTGGSGGTASGGIGGGGAGGGMAGTGTGGTGGTGEPTVTIELTTLSYDGEYAPLNYGAVWFEKADGSFIKTAKRWAGTTHATDLVAWTEASGGWGSIFGGGNTADMADAISSATIRTHQLHTITWDMMDSAALVADGDYVAVLEMSESRSRDREGPLLRIPFTKGPSPQTAEPPDQEGFTGVVLTYAP